MSDEPTRWLDDPSVPEALRADLRSVVEHPPQIPLPPDPPVPAPSLGPTLMGITAVVGLGIAAVVFLPPSHPAVEPPTKVAPVTLPEPPMVDEPLPAEPVVATEETPVDEPAPEALPEPEARETEPVRSAEQAAPTLADEIAHMAELRRIAESNPRAALRMAREGERRFASGLFGEERQALVVLSLDRLGRGAPARRSAERFLARYPHSTFAAAIRPIAQGAER